MGSRPQSWESHIIECEGGESQHVDTFVSFFLSFYLITGQCVLIQQNKIYVFARQIGTNKYSELLFGSTHAEGNILCVPEFAHLFGKWCTTEADGAASVSPSIIPAQADQPITQQHWVWEGGLVLTQHLQHSQLWAVYSENIKRKINIPIWWESYLRWVLKSAPWSWMNALRCAVHSLRSICYLDTALDTTSGWVREVFMAPEPGGDDCSGPLSVLPAEIRSAVRFQSFWLTLK